MAEVLLDIAQNASIRGMRVDGVDLFSVFDFITYVCPGKNRYYASTLWYRISHESQCGQNDHTAEMTATPKFQMCKFTGERQRNTPLGLKKLLLIRSMSRGLPFARVS